jgi:signal transduction histidine kinase/CheY-like chemotaxis protein
VTADLSTRPTTDSPRRRTLALRWNLVLLVVGALIPMVAFAAVVVYQLAGSERTAAERRLIGSASDLTVALDREIQSTIRTLNALAESEELKRDDLKAFHALATRVVSTQRSGWLAVILLVPDGRQVANTNVAWGTPLPTVLEPASLNRLIVEKRPVVGSLTPGKLRSGVGFSVRVPVLRDNQVRYALTAVITPEALSSLVRLSDVPNGEWTRAILDSQGVIVARSRDPERFIGQPAKPDSWQIMQASEQGLMRRESVDGGPVYVAFSREPFSGWTVTVAVQASVLDASNRHLVLTTLGLGLALLALSVIGAFALSRRISHGLKAATAAAETMARGGQPRVAPSAITEVVQLGHALENSAALLAQRERERDEHLARAEAASQLKDEFLATVSHELRTPLNAILGWVDILRQKRPDDALFSNGIEALARNARAQAQIINDILDVSRIITGKLRIEPQPLALAPVIAAAVETVRPAALAKDVQLTVALGEQVGLVTGDSGRLQQVIWNLVSNAIKFTPRGGHVEVRLAQVDRDVELIVRDSGKGISTEFLPHVFERFRQQDGSTTRQHGGLGLGLAIVRHLVEMHGGTVTAASNGEGRGSVFTVRLPVTVPASQALQASATQADATNRDMRSLRLDGVRVLLVDDEPDARDMLTIVLTNAGATVRTTDLAVTAFEEMSAWRPDVLVSDIAMPVEDGYSLIRKVRALPVEQGGQTPALALTAYARGEDRARALAAGFQMYLAKPVETAELLNAVARLAGCKGQGLNTAAV